MHPLLGGGVKPKYPEGAYERESPHLKSKATPDRKERVGRSKDENRAAGRQGERKRNKTGNVQDDTQDEQTRTV